MGEFAVVNAGLPTSREELSTPAVPPQVLARWAALAGERACLSMLPQQVRTA